MAANIGQQERLAFIRQAFSQYYKQHIDGVALPPEFQSREYGFLSLGEKIMIRHKSIKAREDLANLIQTIAPSNIYYSAAYYANPTESMEKKGWLGADLVFDIDADHISYTTCRTGHDTWRCTGCERTGQGAAPAQCPDCGKTRFEEHAWFCDACLGAAKNEMIKLRSFLIDDFGMVPQELTIFFSGHRGYHLHARNANVRALGEAERKEIVDYVLGLGLDLNLSIYKRPRDIIVGPQLGDPGWRGRSAKEFHRIITEENEKGLTDLGVSKRAARYIISERPWIRENWKTKIMWSQFEDGVRITPDVYAKIFAKAIESGFVRADIDTVVTADTHRLIRLPETLNGKTGLRAATVPDLNTFDPFTSALAFEGEETIKTTKTPSFRIADKHYGPYNEEIVTLPTSAAMLLLCKGLAKPIGC